MINNVQRFRLHIALLSIIFGTLAGIAIKVGNVPVEMLFILGIVYGVISVTIALFIDRKFGR